MTLEEAIEHCEERAKICDECGKEHDQLAEWLKEVQQYREIGTLEEFEKLKLAENGIIWGLIDEYVAYKQVGTVEECREAVKKQKPKEPTVLKQQHSDSYNCPKCGRNLILKCGTDWFGGQHYKSCPNCGQAIQWENLEGMEDD